MWPGQVTEGLRPCNALGRLVHVGGVHPCIDSGTPLPASSSLLGPLRPPSQAWGISEDVCAILKTWIASIFSVVVSRLKKIAFVLSNW